MKKPLLFLLVYLYATQIFPLSNQEVRTELHGVTTVFNLPLQIDAITKITAVDVFGARGLMYTYKLSIYENEYPDFSVFRSSVYQNVLTNLCTNNEMYWYKENNVDMIYQYLDADNNPLVIFSINSFQC